MDNKFASIFFNPEGNNFESYEISDKAFSDDATSMSPKNTNWQPMRDSD
jgi:hypothetical protein